MEKPLFTIQRYSALSDQSLQNVHIYTPSIIWVKSGIKMFFEDTHHYEISKKSWLLTNENCPLNFVNKASKETFNSVQISFSFIPPEEMIMTSINNNQGDHANIIPVSPPLAHAFSILIALEKQKISNKSIEYYLLGFYQQLSELGALHILFPKHAASFQNKLSAFLSLQPDNKYQLDEVAEHFAISRSTLIRRLQSENTNFRTVLSNVRMTYALSLMQNNKETQLDLALQCGYQSESRFSHRFKETFGITPKQYMRTIPVINSAKILPASKN